MKTKIILVSCIFIIVAGCQSEPPSKEVQESTQWIAHYEWEWTNGMVWPADTISPEIVMAPGMQITAHTKKGEIIIRAGDGFDRFYTWDGATRSIELWPRKSRWYGSLGIYYPGSGQHWKSNHGVTRGVLNEGVLWFRTADDALAWIKRARSTGADYVYTSSGLVVGWDKVLLRKQLNVDVWQFMIDGKKPQSLPGSQNDLIKVIELH